jgi:acetolactate synthase I/II/III large subunit
VTDPEIDSARRENSDPPPRELTGARLVWEALVREGVDVVFGYPGAQIMPTHDVLPEYPIHHVLVRHEQGAAHAADGYARASGKVGVAIVTSGPGATNLTTGIANAMLDSVPIVCITGQVPSHLLGTDAFQEVDITGVTLPITKHSFLVTEAAEIMPALKRAFEIARSGRPGPVVVDITRDAQQGAAAIAIDDAPVRSRSYRPRHQPDSAQYAKAAEMIRHAERPILFCGHGIILANATEKLLDLAHLADIPVAATLLGLGGCPASDSHYLGLMGMHGMPWVNHAIQRADLIVALGMRFDDRVTGNLARYAPKAKIIHVDRDRAEIGKNVRTNLALVADVGEALRSLIPLLAKADRSEWRGEIAAVRREHSTADRNDPSTLRGDDVIREIWRATEGKALIATDVGQNQMWTAQLYAQERPRKLMTSGGLGTMGFGLPAAIGAKFACPDDEVWVVAGDGGFQMTAAELSTIAQERIKLNIAVINNGFLGLVRQWQELFYEKRYVATPMLGPDFVKLADAHGLKGIRVSEKAKLRSAIDQARRNAETTVIDFRVEPMDIVYPMVPAGADIGQMILRPNQKRTEPT